MAPVRARDALIVLPYLGYGTPARLTLRGRVLEDEGFLEAHAGHSRWRNLLEFVKRMESDEVPGARVRARGAEGVTDGEGYFSLKLEGAFRPGWNPVRLELLHPAGAKAVAQALVPPPHARFGVISDIDDTVVYSHVTRRLRMLLTVALGNARTRKPFAGVAAFYRALHAGANPLFYVSKSPWNLYVPLIEYLRAQGLPRGPLLLRDFGWKRDREHKAQAILRILGTYPELPFVLIGDSGEEDPAIYAAIVRRFPRRIRAVYIRSIDLGKVDAVTRLARELRPTGCQLVLAPDSAFAAAHAAGEGLIQPSALRAVRAECEADASASKPAASSGSLKK